MGYIYKIVNEVNNKIYIGQTCYTLEKRFNQHLKDAIRYPYRPLYRAILKYGSNHFKIETIEECEESMLDSREQFWIQYYDSYHCGYNATLGGESRKKYDHNQILNLWYSNPRITEKEIAELINCCPDVVQSVLYSNGIAKEEIKEHQRLFFGKEIAQLDLVTGEILNIFPTVADACKFLGKQSSGHFAAVCQGKRKSIYGFNWKYIKDLK